MTGISRSEFLELKRSVRMAAFRDGVEGMLAEGWTPPPAPALSRSDVEALEAKETKIVASAELAVEAAWLQGTPEAVAVLNEPLDADAEAMQPLDADAEAMQEPPSTPAATVPEDIWVGVF